ncbi:MAG: SMC-Scp complex subunit ScpB, partial [Bacteroidia bacterium]
GGGWQFLTKPLYHKTVALINGDKFIKRLSAAALETLAIIAYKQPITKSEIESIRGVNCDYAVQKLLEKDLVSVKPDGTLKNLVEAVSKSKRNICPVVDTEKKLQGIIQLDDIRHVMFKPELYEKVTIRQLMHPPADNILQNESMEEVMQKFDRTGAWNLPVIDQNGIYIGLISKSKIFSQYRNMLKKDSKSHTEVVE